MWYDKYFHFWQRKNVFDVYLKHEGYTQTVVVVLNDGREGEGYLPSDERSNSSIKIACQNALLNANQKSNKVTDYDILKKTLNTTRPDPALVSCIEKGFMPGFTRNRNQPRTDPSLFPPQGRKQ